MLHCPNPNCPLYRVRGGDNIVKFGSYNTKYGERGRFRCNRCGETGFKGRIGVFEVMVMDESIRRLVFQRPNADDIRQLAIQNGMTTMREDAIQKMLDGVTTPEEVKKRVFVDEDVAEER